MTVGRLSIKAEQRSPTNSVLGGVAIADPRHVVEVTKLKRPPNGVEEVPDGDV